MNTKLMTFIVFSMYFIPGSYFFYLGVKGMFQTLIVYSLQMFFISLFFTFMGTLMLTISATKLRELIPQVP
jgi:hypothetical protein